MNLVQRLVARGEVKVSEHGYDELAEDGIFARDIVDGVAAKAEVVATAVRFPVP